MTCVLSHVTHVIPAEAGIQESLFLDPSFRWDDKIEIFNCFEVVETEGFYA